MATRRQFFKALLAIPAAVIAVKTVSLIASEPEKKEITVEWGYWENIRFIEDGPVFFQPPKRKPAWQSLNRYYGSAR